MFLMETFAGFDALALGVVVGSAALLASLIWVLVDNRQFEDFGPAPQDHETDDARPAADETRPAADETRPAPEHPFTGNPRTPHAA